MIYDFGAYLRVYLDSLRIWRFVNVERVLRSRHALFRPFLSLLKIPSKFELNSTTRS